MGRPTKHRIVRDHNSHRFVGKVRMSTCVHGHADNCWYAQFLVSDKWQPYNPVSLSTTDFEEACERARDRYAAVQAGSAITKQRQPPLPENTFGHFARSVITDLEQQAALDDRIAQRKGDNKRVIAGRIRQLMLKWDSVPIAKITEDDLNDWIRDDYRVLDRVKGQPNGWKVASASTLGNLDWAFSAVWDKAVKAKVVPRRARPTISQDTGTESEKRPFIDHAGVQALRDLMTDSWIERAVKVEPAHRRLIRAYIAVAVSTGIRPGLELERVTIGSVRTDKVNQIIIRVAAHQGKHSEERSVVVFEAGHFPARRLLLDLLARRRAEGAHDHDPLFAFADNTQPDFAKGVKAALTSAGVLTDPETGRSRVAYSFRHYFATLQIEQGLSVLQIADWMGTGTKMIEQHYNRYLTERSAHLLNGYRAVLPTDWEIEIETDRLNDVAEAIDPEDHQW